MGCAGASNVTFCDPIKTPCPNETSAPIISVTYFPGYGRATVLDFMLNHAGVKYERKQLHPVSFYAGSTKKTFGGMPFAQRADGSYMQETVPIARYIARIHGYWPSDPKEAFDNDYLVQIYQPIINGMDANIFMFGAKKKANKTEVTENLLKNFSKKIEP